MEKEQHEAIFDNGPQTDTFSYELSARSSLKALEDDLESEANNLSITTTTDKKTRLTQKLRFVKLKLSKFLSYCGPGYLIAIGYMDPGNWATDIEAGSSFAYSLLYVVLISNAMAMVLQYFSLRLGIISGLDLAQACSIKSPLLLKWILYIFAEIAMIATDLAEVIGTAIALKLLFKLPVTWGVLLTCADVLLLLCGFLDPSLSIANEPSDASDSNAFHDETSSPSESTLLLSSKNKTLIKKAQRNSRIIEFIIMILMTTIGICFTLEWFLVQPSICEILKGLFIPDVSLLIKDERALYLCLGIIGATVMPHNLYLHSHLIQSRVFKEETRRKKNLAAWTHHHHERKKTNPPDYNTLNECIKYATIDSNVALFFAFLINAGILITAAAGLNKNGANKVTDIEDAANLLENFIGPAASVIFGLALLACGQSSVMTGTLAGQVVFEGFLKVKIKPWIRRLLVRGLSIIPAFIAVLAYGDKGLSTLLLLSQVILSFQLPFAIIPLIYLNIDKEILAWRQNIQVQNFTPFLQPVEVKPLSKWILIMSIIIALLIIVLNLYLIIVSI